jgi:hypothetical protein
VPRDGTILDRLFHMLFPDAGPLGRLDLVWQGLRRAGVLAEATRLARKSFDLFAAVWTQPRLCPENYNAETGEPLDRPDTDGFTAGVT